MNQRILLFIVIFLGFLIVVGTTVVITTVIERSGKVEFFSNNNEEKKATINKNDGLCNLSQAKEVLVISENKIGLHCRGVLEIIDLETGLITHRFF